MSLPSPATFNHPDWIRAILAQVPGATVLAAGGLTAGLRRKRIPVSYFETSVTPLTPAGLPAAAADADAKAFLQAASASVLLRNVPVGHPTTEALIRASSQSRALSQWERAVLRTSGSFDDWLQDNFDHKRRKELKRLRARLAEQGDLRVLRLVQGGALEPFIQPFLALEAASWKGERGTALQNQPAMVKALADGLDAMHAKGRVRLWLMTLNKRPVATLFALVDGAEAMLGKIAHDGAFAKFSPGVQIILEATQDLFTDPAIEFADSNAIPNHPMINRIWRDRLACMDILLAGSNVPAATFNTLSLFLGTKHALRSGAKRVLARVTGRRQS